MILNYSCFRILANFLSSAFVFFRFPCSPDSVTVPAHSPAGASSALRSSSPDSSCASSNSGISMIMKRGIDCSGAILGFWRCRERQVSPPGARGFSVVLLRIPRIHLFPWCTNPHNPHEFGYPVGSVCRENISLPLPPPGRYRHRVIPQKETVFFVDVLKKSVTTNFAQWLP